MRRSLALVFLVFSLLFVGSASAIRVQYTDWQEVHVGEQAVLPLAIDGEGQPVYAFSTTLTFDADGIEFVSAVSSELRVWTRRLFAGNVALVAWSQDWRQPAGQGTVNLIFRAKTEGAYYAIASNVRVVSTSYVSKYNDLDLVEGFIRIIPKLVVVTDMTDDEWNNGDWIRYNLSASQHDFYMTVVRSGHRVAVASVAFVPFGPEADTDVYYGATFAGGDFYSVTFGTAGWRMQARLGEFVKVTDSEDNLWWSSQDPATIKMFFVYFFNSLLEEIDANFPPGQFVDQEIEEIWRGLEANFHAAKF